ncbi:MAG: stage III sporulation protein AB [Eubacterium sp.]
MIYKIVGSVILFLGTAAMGIYYAGQYMERLHNLIELKKALMQMQGELRYLHSAMPEILETIGNRTCGVMSHFFVALGKEMEQKEHGDFESLWGWQVKENIPPSALEPEARSLLLETGRQLADNDRQTKEEGLTFALKQLEEMIHKRNKEKQNRLKLYYVCGIMVGAMLTILLV